MATKSLETGKVPQKSEWMLLRKHSSLSWGIDMCYLVIPNEFVMLPGDLSIFSAPLYKSL